MGKWRVLVGTVSAAQLVWGIAEFVEYNRSVGAPAEPVGGWVLTGLGLLGLLTLIVPRFGVPVAVTQGLAAGYALTWLPFGLICLRTPSSLGFPPPLGQPALGLAILLTAGTTVALCLLNSLGTWKAAGLVRRPT